MHDLSTFQEESAKIKFTEKKKLQVHKIKKKAHIYMRKGGRSHRGDRVLTNRAAKLSE